MKLRSKHNATLGALMLISAIATQPAMAQGSVQHSAQAAEHSLAATGHSLASGAKLVSGVAAVPFSVVGAIGNVSGEIGKGLADAANAPIGEPLPIADDVVSATPSPAQAMQVKSEEIEL